MNKAFTRENDEADDDDVPDTAPPLPTGKNYITQSGYDRLRNELWSLIDEERPRIVEIVNWAACNGDRSENGDYLYGKKRLREIVTGVAGAMGCTAVIDYELGYPVTFNNAEKTSFVAKVAGSLVGSSNVDLAVPPTMGSEDFSFMLEERPGSYIFMGNGDSAGLHHPAYDFNDKAIPVGVSYWASIVETAMPA